MLASGKNSFDEVGQVSTSPLVKIPYQKASVEKNQILGNIPALDPNYGNVWTNISDQFFKAHVKAAKTYQVEIFEKNKLVYSASMPLVKTFSDVEEGKPLMYINSLQNISFALNMLNFSQVHKIYSGPDWNVKISSLENR